MIRPHLIPDLTPEERAGRLIAQLDRFEYFRGILSGRVRETYRGQRADIRRCLRRDGREIRRGFFTLEDWA